MSKDKGIDPVIDALNGIERKLDVLIALTAAQSKLPPEKSIKILHKMGISYGDIEKMLGVSSKTISKEIKG